MQRNQQEFDGLRLAILRNDTLHPLVLMALIFLVNLLLGSLADIKLPSVESIS